MVVGENGVLNRAKDASQKTKAAETDEKTVLEEMENTIKEQTGQVEKWSYTDIDEDGTINVGDVYKVDTESFYVISTDNTTTVTLLAAKCVDTRRYKTEGVENEYYNKQTETTHTVAFDSTEPYSNAYADSTIKGLVDSYVSSLGVTVQEGRLMLKDEAVALQQTGHKDILFAKNFWLGSPYESIPGQARVVFAGDRSLGCLRVFLDGTYGLRPVIVISKPNI